MGILLGLFSAAFFGLSAICVKIGMRGRPLDNGHFMSVVLNCLLIGLVVLLVDLPPWSWTGFVVFVFAGVMTTFLARGSAYTAIRYLGPARQSTILISAPLFAAIIGWLVLGEGVKLLQVIGGLVILLGLVVLIRAKIREEDRGRSSSAGVRIEDANLDTEAGNPFSSSRFTKGFLFALTAALLFGSGFVVRKLGLAYYASPVAGAFFGAMTALAAIAVSMSITGEVNRLIDDNLRRIPWWFVLGGMTSTLALLGQFKAFDYLPAWIVSLLQSTQVVWTLLWSYLFLRQEETIGWPLVLSVMLVLIGVGLMTLQI